MPEIDCLPTETLQKIFGLCTSYEQMKICKVCHRWAEAVLPLMLKWKNLRLCDIEEDYDLEYDDTDRFRLRMIDRKILLKSNWQYTGLEVEWQKEETSGNMRTLKGLLDVCQRRYPMLQRLFLTVPPNQTLVQFFDNRQEWLRNLTKLSLEFVQLGRIKAMNPKDCEISLPKLEQLNCTVCTDDRSFESSCAFTLNVPELCRLTVVVDDTCVQKSLESRFQEPDVCCLFLPMLKLKTTSKLEYLEMEIFVELNQRHIDNSEQFLKNLKVLELRWCSTEVVTQIWKKCSNLEELTISLGCTTPIHVSPVMSRNLEKLKTDGCSLALDAQTMFPKLKYFSANMFSDYRANAMHLVAPQLTKLIGLWMPSRQIILRHKEQLRSMEVTMGHWRMRQTDPPPPNVTELFLRWPIADDDDLEFEVVEDYLIYFPNLKRLKIYGSSAEPLNFPTINELPAISQLQFFCAERFTLRLSDLKKFTGLKSLILSCCTIKMEPDDGEEVTLQALEYCWIKRVEIDGCTGDRFPIRVDDRQTPIEMVEVTAKGRNVFSSSNASLRTYHSMAPPDQF